MSILRGSVGGREQRQVTKALTCTVGKGAIRRKNEWDSVGRDVWEPPSLRAVSFRIPPLPHTLCNKQQRIRIRQGGGHIRIYLGEKLIQKEPVWHPLTQVLVINIFSVPQRFLLPTWHRSKGQEAHSDPSQGSRARLRYGVLPVCPHCARHSTEDITYPENTSWQLTRWHCPHLTDEEPEAQRGKGLV